MVTKVIKRDGQIEAFDENKIADAIFKAAVACGGSDREIANDLAKQVSVILNEKFNDDTPAVEQIQDIVEKVLVEVFFEIKRHFLREKLAHKK